MNHSIYQLKQAWAGLSVRRGFLLTVVTTLGVTIGALLCVLTLAYVMIAKPLPYPEQEKLFQVHSKLITAEGELFGPTYTYPNLIHLYDNQTLFSESAMVHYSEGVISSQSNQPAIRNTFVTPGWFKISDSKMLLGRAFEDTEAKDSYNPVAILSFNTWKNEFNSDSTILEKSVTINGNNFNVVGVLSETFIEPQLNGIGVKTDVYLPWDYNPTEPRVRQTWGMVEGARRFVGKLDSSLSIAQVEQSLTTLVNDKWRENVDADDFFDGWSYEVELQSFKSAILGDSKKAVLLLLVGVIGLVLIACTNITNLFISRTAEQQRQLSIQASLGANKGHLFQTLFAQSGLVVFISVLVALIIASGGFWVLQQYLALRLPRVDELAINSVTLGAAIFISLLLGLFFARMSANIIDYRSLNTTLQSSGKGTGIQVSQTTRKWLVISQVAIVTILILANIGLLRDSIKVINLPVGFKPENITTATFTINNASEFSREETKSLIEELKNKFLALPQVESVGQGSGPFDFFESRFHEIEATQERIIVESKFVDNNYHQMIEQPLIEGDYYSEVNFKDQHDLIIINDVYAKKLVPQGSAIGSKVSYGNVLFTVSGVVKGLKRPAATEDIPLRAYVLARSALPAFLVKLKPKQTLSRELAVATMREVNGQLNLQKLEVLDDQRDQILFTQYTTAITAAVLAILTFFLASVGLYGVLSYGTQMRRFELGTRIAIGAKRKDLIGLIVRDNTGAVVIGIAISVMVLLALFVGFSEELSNYINMQLIMTFFVTLVLIGIMTLFACYWPMRSIINSQPIHSLRSGE
jgi:predicted permease